jgi:hypothetical protein
LAQDIDEAALRKLGARVEHDRLDNVSIKPGAVDDPRIPEHSFDRVFLIHMYHEVGNPMRSCGASGPRCGRWTRDRGRSGPADRTARNAAGASVLRI